MKPKVSIIVPTLNAVSYIRQCIDSILEQTLKEIEVFVVDAASTDGTREIVNWYAEKDSRISLIEDRKKSTGYAKNIGIDLSQAPYIAMVEPDDYIEPDMMEKLFETAEDTGADFVKSNFSTFIGECDKRIDFPKSVSQDDGDYGRIIDPREDNHCFRWIMFEWLGLYRKSFLDKYHIRHNESPGAAFQDTGFWFLTFTYASKIYLRRESFYHYRCDNPYASVKNPDKAFNICREYRYIRKELEADEETWRRVEPAFYRGYFYDNCVVYSRIQEGLKRALLREMRKELLGARDRGVLDRRLYSDSEWEDLTLLLKREEDYVYAKEKLIRQGRDQWRKLKHTLSVNTYAVIYGAGSYGSNLEYLLSQNGIRIQAFVDRDTAKQGTTQNGTVILSLHDCERRFPGAVYLIANKCYASSIKKRLIEENIEENRIIKCEVDQMIPVLI